MRSVRINGEGELRRQPVNPGSHGKIAVKTECVYCNVSMTVWCQVLDDEAEVFVVKMWRLLIYETEAKKLGLVK